MLKKGSEKLLTTITLISILSSAVVSHLDGLNSSFKSSVYGFSTAILIVVAFLSLYKHFKRITRDNRKN